LRNTGMAAAAITVAATAEATRAAAERAAIAQTRVAWVPIITDAFMETDTLTGAAKFTSADSGSAVKSGQLGFLRMKFIL
jgi:hypothetical protein